MSVYIGKTKLTQFSSGLKTYELERYTEETLITPSTTSVTLNTENKLLAADLTVAADENLKAANIKKGVNLFGVTGTAEPPAPNGTAWTAGDTIFLSTIDYGQGIFVGGHSSEAKGLYYSYNGVNWHRTNIRDENINQVLYHEGHWVATIGGDRGGVAYSSDGRIWEKLPSDKPCNRILLNGNKGIFTTEGYGIWGIEFLSDGTVNTWQTDIADCNTLTIGFGGGMWIANGHGLVYSLDGDTWTSSNVTSGTYSVIHRGGTLWVAGGDDGWKYSSDGITWKDAIYENPDNGTITPLSILCENGIWVAGTETGIYYSLNGKVWCKTNLTRGYVITVKYECGIWVAGGHATYYSLDGITWTRSSGLRCDTLTYGKNTWVKSSNTTATQYSMSWGQPEADKYNDALLFRGSQSDFMLAASQVWDGTLQYSTNGVTWTDWDGSEIASANKEIYLRGIGNTTFQNVNLQILSDDRVPVDVLGSVMTLLDYTQAEPEMGNSCFQSLFQNNDALRTAPDLPATTLVDNCYYRMFDSCISLVVPPELPATTLAYGCYNCMFYGCTGLNIYTVETGNASYKWLCSSDNSNLEVDQMFNGCKLNGSTFSNNGTPTQGTNYYWGVPKINAKIVTWADGTDEEIVAMVAAADAGKINLADYWSVGDERTIQLSAMAATGVGESHAAQEATLVLMNAGGKTLAEATESGRTECSFIVGLKNSLAETGYMNSSSTNSGSWSSSARRAWCNSVFREAIPSTIRGIFKQHKNLTIATDNGSTNQETIDYFALPAEKEVFGSATYSNTTEANALSQFTYYATASNRVKKLGNGGSANYWWERSPNSSDSNSFCNVYSDGSASYNRAGNTRGIAPFGVI